MATVQFDIDGVLADFVHGFVRYGGRRLGMMLPHASDLNNPVYGTAHLIGAERSERIWRELLEDPMFWQDLPAAAGYETFRRLDGLQDRHTVYFATNRMGVRAKEQTINWLTARGVRDPTVVLTARKGETAVALGATHAIEDKWGNANYIAYVTQHERVPTKSYLLNRAYNQDPVASKVRRVDTVAQFITDIEEGK